MFEKFLKIAEDVAANAARAGLEIAKQIPIQDSNTLLRPEILTTLMSGEIYLPQAILLQAFIMAVEEDKCKISQFQCLPDFFNIEVDGEFRGGPGNSICVHRASGKLRVDDVRFGLDAYRVDLRILELSLDSEKLISKFALWVAQSLFAAMLKDRIASSMVGTFGDDSVLITQSETDPHILHVDFSNHPMIRQSEQLTSKVGSLASALSIVSVRGCEHRMGGFVLKVKNR